MRSLLLNSLLYYNPLLVVLFKNHDNHGKNFSLSPEKILSQKQINSVLYPDPFLKAGFISRLVEDTSLKILYLDLDLLYSGYITSKMLRLRDNLDLYQPTANTLGENLKEILSKASSFESLVIVDSLNGLFNMLNLKKDVGRTVTSVIMLLASMTRITNSYLLIASMVRYKKEEGWILSPTGKRLIETKNSRTILLEKRKNGISLNPLDNSAGLLIPSNMIPLL